MVIYFFTQTWVSQLPLDLSFSIYFWTAIYSTGLVSSYLPRHCLRKSSLDNPSVLFQQPSFYYTAIPMFCCQYSVSVLAMLYFYWILNFIEYYWLNWLLFMNNYFLIKVTYLMTVKTNINCSIRAMVRVIAVPEFQNNKPFTDTNSCEFCRFLNFAVFAVATWPSVIYPSI